MVEKRRGAVLPALLFTLYMFIFLLSELTVNARCAQVAGAGAVTAVYSLGIVCTSLGYAGFYLSRRFFVGERARKLAILLCAAGYSGCTLGFLFASGAAAFVVFALAALFLFGYIGGFTHYAVALLLFGRSDAGRILGASVAAATLLQFLVQNLFVTDAVLIGSLLLGAAGITYLVLKPVKEWMFENPLPYASRPAVAGKDLLLLVLTVAVMSMCLGLGDGIVTELHAAGALSLTAAPRLLYAVSVLAAGFVADVKGRRLLPLCTLCMQILFSVTALFIGDGNAATNVVYVCATYLCSGFYVMYLTLTFVAVAPMTGKPELWAGMGRIVRGPFIGLTAFFSNALFAGLGIRGIVLVCACLSLAVLVLFVLSGGFELRTGAPEPPRDRMDAFLAAYRLTPREREVFEKLVDGDATNKDLARELYISVRVLERYVSSIYEKTGVQSRVGLVKLYYDRK